MFADMVYEGARSIIGPFLATSRVLIVALVLLAVLAVTTRRGWCFQVS